ncbi:hypothetical protein OC842_008016, partial [Tilletia horrida]
MHFFSSYSIDLLEGVSISSSTSISALLCALDGNPSRDSLSPSESTAYEIEKAPALTAADTSKTIPAAAHLTSDKVKDQITMDASPVSTAEDVKVEENLIVQAPAQVHIEKNPAPVVTAAEHVKIEEAIVVEAAAPLPVEETFTPAAAKIDEASVLKVVAQVRIEESPSVTAKGVKFEAYPSSVAVEGALNIKSRPNELDVIHEVDEEGDDTHSDTSTIAVDEDDSKSKPTSGRVLDADTPEIPFIITATITLDDLKKLEQATESEKITETSTGTSSSAHSRQASATAAYDAEDELPSGASTSTLTGFTTRRSSRLTSAGRMGSMLASQRIAAQRAARKTSI